MKNPPILLLADDDAEDREMFEETLLELVPEATIISVKDGAEAIVYLSGKADSSMPDAVILDYNMPNKNGPDVLDWLVANQEFKGVSRFVWSTAAQKEYIDNCMAKGALDYYVKPNDETGLQNIIKKIFAVIRPENKA